MKDVLVCWSGNPERPWRDASAFVLAINRLGTVAHIDLNGDTFPERHRAALVKCCIFRWRYGNEWFMAQTMTVREAQTGIINVRARVLEGQG